jgi:hypothetical protein
MSIKKYIISRLNEFVKKHKTVLFKYDFDTFDLYHIIEVKGYAFFEETEEYPDLIFSINDFIEESGSDESFYFIEYDSPLGCPNAGEIISYSSEKKMISAESFYNVSDVDEEINSCNYDELNENLMESKLSTYTNQKITERKPVIMQGFSDEDGNYALAA